MEELDVYKIVARQKAITDELLRLQTNISKDGPGRKTREYAKKKLEQVEVLWSEFERNHEEVKNFVKKDTPYMQNNTAGKVQQIYQGLSQYLRSLADGTPGEEEEREQVGEDEPGPGAAMLPPPAATESKHKSDNRMTEQQLNATKLIRREKMIAQTMKHLLNSVEGISSENWSATWCRLKIDRIQSVWAQMEEIHHQIAEVLDDSMEGGYNIEEYLEFEDRVQNCLLTLTVKLEEKPAPTQPDISKPTVKLPKLTLPKFDGDYLKWKQFSDLFTELVHKQPIADCQKLFYLKTTLCGEAEKLVRHFTTSDSNYSAAWKVITDRFDNPRLLVSAQLNKLCAQPVIQNESSNAIKALHDTTQECLLGLKDLQIDTNNWDPLVMNILLKKLDRNNLTLWEQSLKQPKALPVLSDFLTFLETRFQSLEALGPKTYSKPYSDDSKRPRKLTLSATNDDRCVICNQESHPLFKCPKFNCMTTRDRITQIKAFKRCFNCLRSGHQTTDCKSGHCTKCNKYHHTLLHISTEDKKQQCSTIASRSILSSAVKMTAKPNENAPMAPNNATLAAFNSTQEVYVFLSTVNVQLMTQNGTSINCRAILDSGSQVNLITERMIRKLRLPLTYHPMRVQEIGEIKRESHRRANISIKSNVTNFNTRLEAIVLRQIVSPQPSQTFDISKWKIPGNIQLADPLFNTPRPVDLLIGAEFFHQLLCVGQIKLGEQLPLLQNTLLGWVVTGKMCGEPSSSTNICGVYAEEKALEKAISKFWETEDVSSSTSNRTLAEEKCEELFNQTITRDSKGRFVARLPFSDSPDKLGCSSDIALSRFYAIERKLTRNPELKSEYSSFMNEYLDLGHMKEINYKTIKIPHYFLPHHCVLKPESSTTKLRVVFDASAKTSSNISLNDILYTGPKTQDDLFTILLRFRLPKYVMKADIQKMYRQIRITEEDQTFQLIWWRSDPTKPLKCYKLSTITYGTTSAPYLATKCLQLLAKEYESKYPLGSQVLQRDFYVDDAMTGADSLIEAKIIQKQLSSLLWEGGFHLKKWCSNNENLLSNVPLEDQEVPLTEDDDEGAVKTLGLIWRPKSDVFCIKTNCSTSTKFTKRSVASDIARLFDPLVHQVEEVLSGTARTRQVQHFPTRLQRYDPFISSNTHIC